MTYSKRIRSLWIVSLFTTLDAWLCLLSLWLLVYFVDHEQLRSVGRSLGFLIGICVAITCICCLILLAILPRGQEQTADADQHKANQQMQLININTVCLVMTASIAALFLCLMHTAVTT